MDDDYLIKILICAACILSWILGYAVGIGTYKYKSSLEEGKFCPKCGVHYSETDLYCTNDGTELLIVGGN